MNTQTKKIISIVSAVVIILVIVWALSSKTSTSTDQNSRNQVENQDGVVATVNGQEVLRSEYTELQSSIMAQQGVEVNSLDETQQAQLQSQIIDALISQTLLAQASQAAGIKILEADVNVQLQLLKERFPDVAAYQDALAGEGLTEEDLKEQTQLNLAMQTYLNQELDLELSEVTEAEITALYNQQAANLEDAPALEDVRTELEQVLLQQKQQELIIEHVQQLRADADIEILI